MTFLSLHLAKAVSGGRAVRAQPRTRAHVLVQLLRKRAVAQNVGAEELEGLLRDQILWALPIEFEPETLEAA
jgi:hypothetical protein